jgi:hypothetical protein
VTAFHGSNGQFLGLALVQVAHEVDAERIRREYSGQTIDGSESTRRDVADNSIPPDCSTCSIPNSDTPCSLCHTSSLQIGPSGQGRSETGPDKAKSGDVVQAAGIGAVGEVEQAGPGESVAKGKADDVGSRSYDTG